MTTGKLSLIYCPFCGREVPAEPGRDLRGNRVLRCPKHEEQSRIIDWSRSAD
jgi:hypothetical protein